MTREQILQEINGIFIETLDNKDIVIKEATQATDVEEWDSLSHIMLVVAIEKHFGVQFKSNEIQSWNDVGAMIDTIASKSTS